MPLPGAWVIPRQKKVIVVGVADMVASNDTSTELVTYSLGSCLGVAVYDPVKRVGGLLHLMLPDSTIDPVKARNSPYMFVDTGVPRLFHQIYGLGGLKQNLIVKVAGGAQFLDDANFFNIGERNCTAINSLLANNSHSIQALDVGGRTSRTLRMDLSSGNVSIQSPGMNSYQL